MEEGLEDPGTNCSDGSGSVIVAYSIVPANKVANSEVSQPRSSAWLFPCGSYFFPTSCMRSRIIHGQGRTWRTWSTHDRNRSSDEHMLHFFALEQEQKGGPSTADNISPLLSATRFRRNAMPDSVAIGNGNHNSSALTYLPIAFIQGNPHGY